MSDRIVIDSGPCIALFDRDDAYHERALSFIRDVRGVLLANLAVVTEVMYVLDFSLQAQQGFLAWLRKGAVTLVETDRGDLDRVSDLMQKYADPPMDFTDATLVALAERIGVRTIASIDSHFSIYRFRGRSRFRNVFPDVR